MITGEVRNRIDQIWDAFWTGGIANPIDVLEQMTFMFFIKMIDDIQIEKEATAKMLDIPLARPIFKEGMWHNPDIPASDTSKDIPYEKFRWQNFKDYTPEQLFFHFRENIFPFIKTLDGDNETAFSTFMKDATFKIPSAHVLGKVIDGISKLDTNNRDMMGDVYEYALYKMASSGTNGQFRTPRHIIRMMVELMKPTLNDTICDPAMGSAGFIVEAAKYIVNSHSSEMYVAENTRHYKTTMFNGFDTDQTMLRIGAMNLMLHGVEEPHIEYRDSLSTDNNDENLYDLILANPPFAGSLDEGIVNKSLHAIAPTKKTELLFISLFIRSLKIAGRCASIVPDGVLFGNSKAHKSVRKELVENQRLQAVISMPSGVFQPYSGVSTAVLIFTKTNHGGTDKVWFYDMKADGFTLDQKRTECKENDIPDIIARFNKLEKETSRTRKDQSFLVSIDDIRANDYDLSINKYKEVEREVVEYEAPDVIWARMEERMNKIQSAMVEFKSKYLK